MPFSLITVGLLLYNECSTDAFHSEVETPGAAPLDSLTEGGADARLGLPCVRILHDTD